MSSLIIVNLAHYFTKKAFLKLYNSKKASLFIAFEYYDSKIRNTVAYFFTNRSVTTSIPLFKLMK